MPCNSPVLRKRKETGEIVECACGQCLGCLIANETSWTVRTWAEHMSHPLQKSAFVRLSYAPEFLPSGGNVCYAHMDDFFHDLRGIQLREAYKNYRGDMTFKQWSKSAQAPPVQKHFAVAEYGETYFRPHYHFILFGVYAGSRTFQRQVLEAWSYGFVDFRPWQVGAARYCLKYMHKETGKQWKEKYPELVPPKMFYSRGIGRQYCLDNREKLLENGYVEIDGKKYPLPKYFKKKLGIEGATEYETAYNQACWENSLVDHNFDFYETRRYVNWTLMPSREVAIAQAIERRSMHNEQKKKTVSS